MASYREGTGAKQRPGAGKERSELRGLEPSSLSLILPQSPSPHPHPKVLSQTQLFFNGNAQQLILHENLQPSAPWEPHPCGEGALGL